MKNVRTRAPLIAGAAAISPALIFSRNFNVSRLVAVKVDSKCRLMHLLSAEMRADKRTEEGKLQSFSLARRR